MSEFEGLPFSVHFTQAGDIDAIIELCEAVYVESYTWGPNQLGSHLEEFPAGQFVVKENASGRVVGMAASLIVDYSKYTLASKWKDLTEWGYFGTHDALHGHTLYGAEVMVHPHWQGKGVGKLLYRRREQLARELKLHNIRAGARISGYHRYHEQFTALEYVDRVVKGEIGDPTLSFQLKRGFHVVGITPRYFYDPESLDYAAVIEWTNPEVVLTSPSESA